jgi:hypothetical protein
VLSLMCMGVRLHNCKGITKGVGAPPHNSMECEQKYNLGGYRMVRSFQELTLSTQHAGCSPVLSRQANEAKDASREEYMRRVTVALCSLVAVLLLPPAGPATPAHAVTVDINISIGTNLSSGRPITCRAGERLLRERGFREIRRTDCRGRYFVYRAWRRNTRFEIALRSRDGRVVDMRRLRR